MAVSAHSGSFNITTQTAGNTVEVRGVGFQPVAVIFWYGGRTESTDAEGGGDHHMGAGFMYSATGRGCIAGFSEDAVGTSVCRHAWRNDACINEADGSGHLGRADFSAWDTGNDGFDLVIDAQFTTDMRISYLALGGDVANPENGTLTTPTTGPQSQSQTISTTNVPKVVFFFAPGPTDVTNSAFSNGSVMVGCATGSANEWVALINPVHGQGTSDTYSYGYGDEVIALADHNGLRERASFTSFDSGPNGFTIQWHERINDGNMVQWFTLSGSALYQAGDSVTRTDGNDIDVTTTGMDPAALLVASHGLVESTQDTLQSDGRLSLGGASGTGNRSAHACSDQDNLATTEVYCGIEHDEVYIHPDLADGSDALMDLKSFGSGKFTLVMDDFTDSTARFFGYLAIGDTPAVTATPLQIPHHMRAGMNRLHGGMQA